jgi:hypothetical protein
MAGMVSAVERYQFPSIGSKNQGIHQAGLWLWQNDALGPKGIHGNCWAVLFHQPAWTTYQ